MSRIGVRSSSTCILRSAAICQVLLHIFALTLAFEVIGEGGVDGNNLPRSNNRLGAKASLTIENAMTIIYGGSKTSQAAVKKISPAKKSSAPSQAPKSSKSSKHSPKSPPKSSSKQATSDASTFKNRLLPPPPPLATAKANKTQSASSSGKNSASAAGSTKGNTTSTGSTVSNNKGSSSASAISVNTTQSQGGGSGSGSDGINFNVSQTQTTVNSSQSQGVFVTKAPAPAQPPVAAKYFTQFATTSVSGIHTVYTHLKTVLYIDRTDVANTFSKLPNGKTAYAEEYSFASNSFRPLDVKSNVFCSAGVTMPDGAIMSIGGSSNGSFADPLLNGAASMRSFIPCTGGPKAKCDFKLIGSMTSKRWYPTAQLLPDGRVMIVGGANTFGNIVINTVPTNNPTYEYWPRAPGEGNYLLDMLTQVDNLPFNLYPFVHVLPSGLVFIFAGQLSVLLDYTVNRVVRTLPRLDQRGYSGYKPGMEFIQRNYPMSGTSALLPLSADNGWQSTVLICGGNFNNATSATPSPKGKCLGCGQPATDTCAFIQPESLAPQWTYERMVTTGGGSAGRVMPDAVLLLDDVVLVCNGAAKGFQGLKQNYASMPQLKPLLYDTRLPVGQRFTEVQESSGIPRMYHSSALLLSDGTVLISGSNPNMNLTLTGAYPTEFRTQIFSPHYLQWGVSRNLLWRAPRTIPTGTLFGLILNTTIPTPPGLTNMQRFRVVIAHPGFATHNQRHGMRNVFLPVVNVIMTALPGGKSWNVNIVARGPPNVNIAPPTIYWLHALDQGGYKENGAWKAGHWVPNVEGQWVKVIRGN